MADAAHEETRCQDPVAPGACADSIAAALDRARVAGHRDGLRARPPCDLCYGGTMTIVKFVLFFVGAWLMSYAIVGGAHGLGIAPLILSLIASALLAAGVVLPTRKP